MLLKYKIGSFLTIVWKDKPGLLLLFEIFDPCSPSRLAGHVLKLRSVILANEGLILLGNHEHQFFKGFSFSAEGSTRKSRLYESLAA